MNKANMMKADLNKDFYYAKDVDPTLEHLQKRIKKLEEALTPSAETKYHHIGEHMMEVTMFDEDGNDVIEDVIIPWTVIKQIMKSILDYTTRPSKTGEVSDD